MYALLISGLLCIMSVQRSGHASPSFVSLSLEDMKTNDAMYTESDIADIAGMSFGGSFYLRQSSESTTTNDLC